MDRRVSIGLVQLRCTPDPDRNVAQAVEQIRIAAGGGAQIICLPELFRSLYFCQREDHAFFSLAEPIPGPDHGVALSSGRRVGRGDRRQPVREAGGRALPQYGRRDRRRRCASRQVPQDAHSRRPALLREVLFHAGRPRLSGLSEPVFPLGVLVCWDQWYPGGGPAHRAAGGGDPVLSDRHRLASVRKSRVRTPAASELGIDPTFARRRQRLLCRQRQPHGTRRRSGQSGRRHRVLGPKLRRRYRVARSSGAVRSTSRPRRSFRSIWPSSTWSAPIGPSSAIAASTPTAISPGDTSTNDSFSTPFIRSAPSVKLVPSEPTQNNSVTDSPRNGSSTKRPGSPGRIRRLPGPAGSKASFRFTRKWSPLGPIPRPSTSM